MPQNTPNQKIQKVRKFGGEMVEVRLVGYTYDESSQAAQEYCKLHEAVYVHPFDDFRTIAGQATVGMEIYGQLSGILDYVICPIGGGGLISGVGSFISQQNSKIKILGAEPSGAAGMFESLKAEMVAPLAKIDTFVDGAAVKTVGNLNFKIVKELNSEIVLVPEGEVCTQMINLYQNEGIIAEPAGVLSIGALEQVKDQIKNKIVVCIISGGNNDLLRYPEIMERNLVYKGLKHYFIIEFAQKPGQLKKFVDSALGPDDDIVRFEYIKKTNKEKGAALVGIELSYKEDLEPLLKRMDEIGLTYKKITASDLLYEYLI